MAEVFFDNPPILNGDERSQLLQLQRYLSTMSDKLNTALMTISIEQMAPETQQVIREAGTKKAEEQYSGLKAMIVKTAEIVRHEMDEIRTTLQDEYEAISDEFGTLESTLTNEITATAQGVQQNFTRITSIEGKNTGYDSFIDRYSSHIFIGIIGQDPITGQDITGISIGNDIVDGNGRLIQNNQMATFTADKLSFYQNGIEMGYYTGNVFYISQGEILNSLKIGNHYWKKLTGGALALIAGGA